MSVKKILALLLAAMMVFGMTSALAADPTLTDLNVPVTKTVYFFNDKGGDVYEPNISYTFTLSVPTDAQLKGTGTDYPTVTDANSHTATIKAGTAEAIKTESFTVDYKDTHAKVTVDKDYGAEVTKAGNLVIDPNGFRFLDDGTVDKTNGVLKAGIYRYIITETVKVGGTAADVTAAGLTARENYTTTRILDVYVTNDGTTTPIILDDPNDPDDDVVGNDPTPANNTEKTEGFGDEDKPGDGEKDNEDQPSETTTGDDTNDFSGKASDGTVDRYTTYNMTIKKTVGGDMGDKSNKFPFKVDIANSIKTNAFDYTVAGSAVVKSVVGNDNTFSFGKVDGTTTDITLKDAETIELIGVPSSQTGDGATAVVNEYNNTNDTYKAKAIYNNGSDVNYLSETDLASKTATNITATIKVKEENTVEFTNSLENVSPTGVVLRFAPYFAMFAAGCVLFLILATKRSKKEEE